MTCKKIEIRRITTSPKTSVELYTVNPFLNSVNRENYYLYIVSIRKLFINYSKKQHKIGITRKWYSRYSSSTHITLYFSNDEKPNNISFFTCCWLYLWIIDEVRDDNKWYFENRLFMCDNQWFCCYKYIICYNKQSCYLVSKSMINKCTFAFLFIFFSTWKY